MPNSPISNSHTPKTHSPKIEALLWSWMSFARKFRVGIIVFWTVLAALGVWLSATFLGINTDTSDMIDEQVPYRVAQSEFETAFPDINNQILVIIRADSADALDIYSSELAKALDVSELTRSVTHLPSDPFFLKNGLLYLETDELESQLAQLTEAAPLIERLTLSPKIETLFDTLAELAEQDDGIDANGERLLLATAKTLEANISGTAQPLSWREAFSEPEEGADPLFQTVITLSPVLDHSRVRAAVPVQDLIDELAIQTVEISGVNADVFVTGNPVLRSDELKSVSQGIGLAFLISFIIVGIILFIALRSPVLVVFVLLSLIISILITAGLGAVIYGQLNLVSIAFTVLMVGLGVDFAIHLLMHLQSKRGKGLSVPAAFYRVSRGIGTALVLTAPSTALAFLAFVPTKFVGISQLGVIAAIGVSIAFLVATSLLPAIFSYLPAKTVIADKSEETVTRKPTSLNPKMRSRLAVLVILLGVCALALMPKARFDADPMALRDQSAPSVTAFNLLFSEPETVPYRLSALAESPESAKALSESLEKLETVDSSRNLLSFIPEEQYDKLDLIDYTAIGLEFALSGEGEPQALRADYVDHLLGALQDSTSKAAIELSRVLKQWEQVNASDPTLKARSEHDLFLYWPRQVERLSAQIQASEVSLDSLPDSLRSRYLAASGEARLEILPAKDVSGVQNRREFITDVTRQLPSATGSARSVQDAGDIIQTSMLQAILTALLSVSILLYLVVRNVKLVAIMLAPLLLAGVLTTATGVIFNLPYNFANVIVLPLLIGIGVDSSLHLALQARHGAVKSKPRQASMFDNVTPRAVIFSAVTTIASFGSLSFSAHRGTASMGLLLMIAIMWVLICTLLVTPTLIEWSSQKRDTA